MVREGTWATNLQAVKDFQKKVTTDKSLRMVIVNVIEAEVTKDKDGKPHTYIIKDKKMEEVTKYVKGMVKN